MIRRGVHPAALIAVLVLAGTLAVVAVPRNTSFWPAAQRASKPEATTSASARKNARKALKLARKADRRAKDAIAAALAPVTSQQIVDETITAADLGNGAVEADEIADGAVGSRRKCRRGADRRWEHWHSRDRSRCSRHFSAG
jgi:hypothetical protein